MLRTLILGAGEAGIRAALALREHDNDVAISIIEAEHGDPYERPPLSKTGLTDNTFRTQKIQTKAQLTERNIVLLDGVEATELNPSLKQVMLSDGTSLSFDKLLIATGASARTLPFEHATAEDIERFVFTLRTANDCAKLRKKAQAGQKVVLIGAGFIGLELAASLRALQIDVTILETQARILQRAIPEDISRIVHQAHHDNGVNVLLNTHIQSVHFSEKAQVTTTSGDTLEADWLVVGIGSLPNTQLAERAGLHIENGIKVNRYMQTSHDDIFAAGDVCSFPYAAAQQTVRLESWRCAQEQASVAALNMLDNAIPYDQAPWFWSDQYHLGLQMVGLSLGVTQSTIRRLPNEAILHFGVNEQGCLLSACGIGLGNAIAKDIKLAERIINQGISVSIDELSDPSISLKHLLKAK
ncbi:NAD(P)/FAD-dependent oxidoreductase [Marinomonas sp. IMCC 4694]|uniref:NAD(P)/FAD-dependent oxidoreductase n=1 Tax=Marinomonas sp. IMCC 4694 TaxID=2605432 RepID=UPI0011E71569|nr:FAD-dependent oxidoreductase [Marinomonas sp. IMCC 4694]TYL46686.1 ferredoxin reductase [Marinomonas sp. IMCC 4694]